MPDSYPFPMYSGIFEPRHYKQIGSALWLFLWCVSSTTKDVEREGVTWGVVLGNKPVRIFELEEIFGVTDKTIRSWIKTLEQHQYIKVTRAPYGLIFSVRNSKKFTLRSVENDRTSPVENYRSLEGDRKKTTDQTEENYRSNKDITEINKAAVVLIDSDEIMKLSIEIGDHFIKRRGKGFDVSPLDFDEIKRMVGEGMPLPIIKDAIDKSFAEYKPRHKHDEIRSITYCVPRCYDEWTKMKPVESITSPAVPSAGSVALGSPRRNRPQLELDDLRRKREEARKRDQG
jgi:predicted transcriptional regulator